jgi:hypothetical protein
VSYFTVPRLRWSGREDAGTPPDWRCHALILATVFLNLSICACLAVLIAWQAHDFSFTAPKVFEFCITGLAAAGGVLSARYRPAVPGRIDVPTTLALLAGWTAPLYLHHPAILPAYGIAFTAGLLARAYPSTIAGA